MSDRKRKRRRNSFVEDPSSEQYLNDEAILLRINLKYFRSVLQYFPLVEGSGKMKQIPLHIRAFDGDYKATFKMIRHFRLMSKEEQELESKYGLSSRWSHIQRTKYAQRLAAMEATKQKVLDEMEAEKNRRQQQSNKPAAVTPSPALQQACNSTTTNRASSSNALNRAFESAHSSQAFLTTADATTVAATAARTATTVVATTVVTTTATDAAAVDSNTADPLLASAVLTTPLPEQQAIEPASNNDLHERAPLQPRHSPPQATRLPLQPPAVPTLDEEDSENIGLSTEDGHVGLFSGESARESLANSLPQGNGTRDRKKEQFAWDPSQLADAYAMKAKHDAMKKFAKAADATYCPTNTTGLHHRHVLVSLCEVKETGPNGGRRSNRYRRLVARSKDDVKAVFCAWRKAYKDRQTNGFERVTLLAKKVPGRDAKVALSDVVERHISEYERDRKAPPCSTSSSSKITLDHQQHESTPNRSGGVL